MTRNISLAVKSAVAVLSIEAFVAKIEGYVKTARRGGVAYATAQVSDLMEVASTDQIEAVEELIEELDQLGKGKTNLLAEQDASAKAGAGAKSAQSTDQPVKSAEQVDLEKRQKIAGIFSSKGLDEAAEAILVDLDGMDADSLRAISQAICEAVVLAGLYGWAQWTAHQRANLANYMAKQLDPPALPKEEKSVEEKPMKAAQIAKMLDDLGQKAVARAVRDGYRAHRERDISAIQEILFWLGCVRSSFAPLRKFIAGATEWFVAVLLDYQVEQMIQATEGFAQAHWERDKLAKAGKFTRAKEYLREAKGVFYFHDENEDKSLPSALMAVGRLLHSQKLPRSVGEFLGQKVDWSQLEVEVDDYKAGLALIREITADRRTEEERPQWTENDRDGQEERRKGKTPDEIRRKRLERRLADQAYRLAQKGATSGGGGGKKKRH